MKLVIENFETAETEALQKAIERAKNFAGDSGTYSNVTLVVQKRIAEPAYKHQAHMIGWLEYPIYFYKDEKDITPSFGIHMIQRTKNAEFEFHS